jgi:hypothetical protein
MHMDRRAKLFAATTVTLGVTSAWLALQLSNERERAAMLAERVAVLEASREPLSGSREAEADTTPATDRDPSATPAEPDSSQIALQRRDTEAWLARFRANQAKLLRNTLYRERWLTMRTLQLRRTYTDLQGILGLSDVEYANFLATIAQFELEQTLRNYEAPLEQGLDTAGRIAAARQQAASTETARRQALRDALGDSQYRQWLDYQRTAEGRQELERWRIQLATAGLSLTADQAQDLLPILVEHQQRITALPNPAVVLARAQATSTSASSALQEAERDIASRADINAWLGDALAGILTAEQRELITAAGNHDIELRRAQLELDRLRIAAQEDP